MSYGFMTHSWLNSTENRQMKQERKEYTAKYVAGELVFPKVRVLLCHCRSFKHSHSPERHKELHNEWDWRVA
jgi:hypothetical protein